MQLKYGITSTFMGGEATPEFAGRIDDDKLKTTVRYASNFMPTCQGGLKKFWGTWLVDKIAINSDKCRLIPVSGMSEPMCLLFVDNKVYKITKDSIVDQNIGLKTSVIIDSSYNQNNAVIYFATKMQRPFYLQYDGEKFIYKAMTLKEEPFFPLSWNKLYNGAIRANGYQGDINIEAILSSSSEYTLDLPLNLGDLEYGNIVATYIEQNGLLVPFAHLYHGNQGLTNDFTISLMRVREVGGEDVESTVFSKSVGSNEYSRFYNKHGVEMPCYCIYRSISLAQFMAAMSPLNPVSVSDNKIFFLNLPSGHQNDDRYYIKVVTTASGPGDYYLGYEDYDYYLGCLVEGRVNDPGHTEGNITSSQDIEVADVDFGTTDVVGMRLRVHLQENATVAVWAKGISITANNVYYSDGKYYKALASGTAGEAQPVHTKGIRSDGNINFEYMHDGYGYATVIDVPDATHMTARVDGYLPVTKTDSVNFDFDHFQWSQWGYKGIYPDVVFGFSGRLGYVLDTETDGSWLQMSKSDSFDDFGVTEHGQVTDTCGINVLISGHPDNNIKWVLSTERLYMGSYSGEYRISGGDSRSNVVTPTSLSITPISSAGGCAVKPVRYKRKSLFVSSTGQMLYNLSYSYQTDDYAPDDLSMLGEELLKDKIEDMALVKDKEGIVSFKTTTGALSYFNYEQDIETLSFYRTNLKGKVLSLCVSECNGKTIQFVVVKRDEGYFVEYIDTTDPSYCLSAQRQKCVGTLEYKGMSDDVVVCCPELNEYYDVKVENETVISGVPVSKVNNKDVIIGAKMPCELHLTPSSDSKIEGSVQKSVRFVVRLFESGPFSYGSSQDFNKYYEYEQSTNKMTGDIMLPSSFGYQQGQNTTDGPYPNDTGIALNLKTDAPLPFNLLLVSSIYV
jgi:hypothetical protein